MMDARIQQRLDAVMGPVKKARPPPKITEAPGTSQWLLVFSALLAFRIVNALTIKTFFQPDEYFQALEPAWKIAFGAESGAWITWVGEPRFHSIGWH
jgi:phosphatidylinositol glycan class B